MRRLTDSQFRALLDLFMCSDPYPDSQLHHSIIEDLLDTEAQASNHLDWIDAYHRFKPEGE